MSGGVRNLRAMFESKDPESPQDSGRSAVPAGTLTPSTDSPQPLAKVRTSFVKVERTGSTGSPRTPQKQSFNFDEGSAMSPEIRDMKKFSLTAPDGSARKGSMALDNTIPESPLTPRAHAFPHQPEISKLEFTKPEVAKSEAIKPEAAKSEAIKSEATEPGATEPEVTEPAVTEPAVPKEATKPEVPKPESAKPESVKNEEAVKPGAVKPEVVEPLVAKPQVVQPEATKLEVSTSEVAKLNTAKFEAVKAEAKKPEVKKHEAKKPEIKKPEVKEPEVKKPEVKEPEVKEPEAKKPEAKKPEVKKLSAAKPEAAKPEAVKPEAAKPQAVASVESASETDPKEVPEVVIPENNSTAITADKANGTSTPEVTHKAVPEAAAKAVSEASSKKPSNRPTAISTAKSATTPKGPLSAAKVSSAPKTPVTPTQTDQKPQKPKATVKESEKKPIKEASKPTVARTTAATAPETKRSRPAAAGSTVRASSTTRGASKTRAASKPRSTGSPPQTGFVKPKPRSPTRPVKLPAGLTAHTASSGVKGAAASSAPVTTNLSRQSSINRASENIIPPQTGFVKPKPRSPTRPVKLPASLTSHTASSGSKTDSGLVADAGGRRSSSRMSGFQAPPQTGFVKPKPRSPTRPVKLPASLTAHTASSGPKTGPGAALNTEPSRSPSRGPAKYPKAVSKSSRPSLGPPPSTQKEKSSRQSLSHASAVDDGVLSRMMRPTASSLQKGSVAEKSAPATKTTSSVAPNKDKKQVAKTHVGPKSHTAAPNAVQTEKTADAEPSEHEPEDLIATGAALEQAAKSYNSEVDMVVGANADITKVIETKPADEPPIAALMREVSQNEIEVVEADSKPVLSIEDPIERPSSEDDILAPTTAKDSTPENPHTPKEPIAEAALITEMEAPEQKEAEVSEADDIIESSEPVSADAPVEAEKVEEPVSAAHEEAEDPEDAKAKAEIARLNAEILEAADQE